MTVLYIYPGWIHILKLSKDQEDFTALTLGQAYSFEIVSICHSVKSWVKSNWEVSHSGLLNENKGVLVSPVKAAKPQVRQLLCFCVQSFSLSPWSFVPAYVSFMLMTLPNDFSRQKGKQQPM